MSLSTEVPKEWKPTATFLAFVVGIVVATMAVMAFVTSKAEAAATTAVKPVQVDLDTHKAAARSEFDAHKAAEDEHHKAWQERMNHFESKLDRVIERAR